MVFWLTTLRMRPPGMVHHSMAQYYNHPHLSIIFYATLDSQTRIYVLRTATPSAGSSNSRRQCGVRLSLLAASLFRFRTHYLLILNVN